MEEPQLEYHSATRYFVGAVLFALGIMVSILFREFDISAFGISSWGYFLFIPAIVFLIHGVRQYYRNQQIKKTLLKSLLNRGYDSIPIDDLSEENQIEPDNILNVLSVLRRKGKIAYQFDAQMNEITVLSIS